jgi:hypothetical protein
MFQITINITICCEPNSAYWGYQRKQNFSSIRTAYSGYNVSTNDVFWGGVGTYNGQQTGALEVLTLRKSDTLASNSPAASLPSSSASLSE